MPQVGTVTKLRVHMTNGTILKDDKALMVGTEVISSLLEDCSFPRRSATLTYTHRSTGQTPTPGDSEQLELGDPRYSDDDTQFMTRGAGSVYRQSKAGLDTERGIRRRLGDYGRTIMMGGAVLSLLLTLGWAMMTSGDQPSETAGTQEAVVETAPPPVILPPTSGDGDR